MTDQHPTVATWTPEPPPPARRRRLGPGLVAALIAVLLLFGGVGLYAARQVTTTAEGASSPEAAAAGLLAAVADKDVDRAAGYVVEHERFLVDTYRDQLTGLATGGSGPELIARDLRFQRVAGLGATDVAVVELVAGMIGGAGGPGESKLEVPVETFNRRLINQTKGAVQALRAVAVRDDGRWRVSLLASAAEHGRLVTGAAEPDWGQLAATGQPAAAGAASPEAAVRDLAAAATGGQQAVLQQLAPAERRVLDAYRPLLSGPGATPRVPAVRVENLQTRTEPIADGVARVRATDGQLIGGMLGPPVELAGTGSDPSPAVVTIRQDGTWYPSLLFSFTDVTLAQLGERP